jgi:hypothetical protein
MSFSAETFALCKKLAKKYAKEASSATTLRRVIVTTLPTDEEAEYNVLYFYNPDYPDTESGQNIFKEYMKIDGKLELMGDSSMDSSVLNSQFLKLDGTNSMAANINGGGYAYITENNDTILKVGVTDNLSRFVIQSKTTDRELVSLDKTKINLKDDGGNNKEFRATTDTVHVGTNSNFADMVDNQIRIHSNDSGQNSYVNIQPYRIQASYAGVNNSDSGWSSVGIEGFICNNNLSNAPRIALSHTGNGQMLLNTSVLKYYDKIGGTETDYLVVDKSSGYSHNYTNGSNTFSLSGLTINHTNSTPAVIELTTTNPAANAGSHIYLTDSESYVQAAKFRIGNAANDYGLLTYTTEENDIPAFVNLDKTFKIQDQTEISANHIKFYGTNDDLIASIDVSGAGTVASPYSLLLGDTIKIEPANNKAFLETGNFESRIHPVVVVPDVTQIVPTDYPEGTIILQEGDYADGVFSTLIVGDSSTGIAMNGSQGTITLFGGVTATISSTSIVGDSVTINFADGDITAESGVASFNEFVENGISLKNKYAQLSALDSYLPLAGGAMTGNIEMQNRAITGASAFQAGGSTGPYSVITPANIVSTSGGAAQTVISPNNIQVIDGTHQPTVISGNNVATESVITPIISVDTIQSKTTGGSVTVNGGFIATTLYENNIALSDKYALKTVVDTIVDNTKTVEIHYFVKDGVTTDTATNTYGTYAAVGTAIKAAIDGDVGNDITFVIHMLKTPTPSDKCIISNWNSSYLGDANRRYTIVLDGTELGEFTYTGTASVGSDDGWMTILFVKNDTPRFTIVLNNLKFTYSATNKSRFVMHQAHAINYIFNNCKIIHAAGSTAWGVIGQTSNLTWSRMGRIIINNSILISKATWTNGSFSGYYPILAQGDYYPQNHIFCYNSYLDHFNSPVSTTIDYTTANAAIAVMINCIIDSDEYLADNIDNGIYHNQIIGSQEGGDNNSQEITYTELKTLRDGGNLVAGTQYRITDYVTASLQSDTQSAGHAFDVIVTADSSNTLNENARAIQHSGDTYFANSDLASWELKYCLDNDTNRFAWADATNGKGVIYWLKDEYGNECGYDFKNIQTKYYKITATTGTSTGLVNTYSGSRYAGVNDGTLVPKNCTISTADTEWRYTFDLFTSNEHKDYSLNKYSSGAIYCYDNKINALYGNASGQNNAKQYINVVNFKNVSTSASCYGNKLGDRNYNYSFGTYCYSNSFGNNCYYNSFGNYCVFNSFGNNCQSNSFGKNCYSNSFGNNCSSNSFGNSDNLKGYKITLAIGSHGYDSWTEEEDTESGDTYISGVDGTYLHLIGDPNDTKTYHCSIKAYDGDTVIATLVDTDFTLTDGAKDWDDLSASWASVIGDNVRLDYKITYTYRDNTVTIIRTDSY